LLGSFLFYFQMKGREAGDVIWEKGGEGERKEKKERRKRRLDWRDEPSAARRSVPLVFPSFSLEKKGVR